MNPSTLRFRVDGVIVSGEFRSLQGSPAASDYPLVVAIHGGTYTHKYFDVEGCSLLDRAERLGLPIFAVDRPCYGDSGALRAEEATIQRSAEILNGALHELWVTQAGGARGIVLVGHSIGGAVAVLVASTAKQWPLLGIAISGVGLRSPDAVIEQWRSLPPVETVALPAELKDQLMFGPASTYIDEVRERAHAADHPAPRQELLDIVFGWPELLASAAPRVVVPVHYRQPEHENLWVVGEDQVRSFGRLFAAAPSVDAALMRSVGHCIDFHRLGASYQLQQLAFALQCSVASQEAA